MYGALGCVKGRVAAGALLACLLLVPSGAGAVVAAATRPYASITSGVSASAGGQTFTYVLSYARDGEFSGGTLTGYSLDRFEIPEYGAGDLVASSLPSGWRVTESTGRSQPGTGIERGASPGAFLLLETRLGEGAAAGQDPLSFVFTTTLAGVAEAAFGTVANYQSYSYSTNRSESGVSEIGTVDARIPMAVAVASAAVPEPASVLVLAGGLLLSGTVRRRRPG